MAAPQLVYSSKLLSGLPIAKLLHNSSTVIGTDPPDWWDDWGDGYFNTSDSDALKLAKIKSIFRLDYLLRTNEGFIGGVLIGGPNATYHNSNRWSRKRLSNSNQVYAVLNDGGLNTFAHSHVIASHIDQVWWANMFSVRVFVKSAYYQVTTKVGFEYKIEGGSWKFGGEIDVNLAAGKSTFQEWRKQDFGFLQSDTLYLRAYATNAEGTRVDTTEISHVLAEKVYNLIGLKVASLGDTSGISTGFYIKESALALLEELNTNEQYIGVNAFDDEKLSNALASGMYRGISGKNPDFVYFVSAGEFTHYAIAIDEDGIPVSRARMYKIIGFAIIGDTSASASFTEGTPYSSAIVLSNGGYQVGGNVYVQGQGNGVGRNANIYCRRTNSRNAALNEDVYAGTIFLEPGVNFNTTISAVFSSPITDYDKFAFLEFT